MVPTPEQKPVEVTPAQPVAKPAVNPVPEVKPATPQTGPKNIDWKQAFKFYCSNKGDGKQRTYKDVAGKFGVSETAVEVQASKGNWVKVREDLGKRGIEQFKIDKAGQIAQSENRHLTIWRGLQQTALELLKDLRKDIADFKAGKTVTSTFGTSGPTTRLRDIVGVLETSVSGERLVLGLPNNVSKADVTSGGKPVELTATMVAEMDAMLKKNEQPKNPAAN